jgi:hypothetical protein
MLYVLVSLIGFLAGLIAAWGALQHHTNSIKRRLKGGPAPTPPPTDPVPFDVWPPVQGTHKVLITKEAHDGDTVQFGLITVSNARLAGLDAPEKNTGPGKLSQQALASRLQVGKLYTAVFSGREKWGRTLVEFFDENGKSINHWMIENGHAAVWDGQGTHPFDPKTGAPINA